MHAEIPDEIDGGVEPEFARLLHERDHAIPGVFLLYFFGVEPPG